MNDGLKDTRLGRKVQDRIVKNAQMMGGPRRRGSLADIAGKIWNAPNTALGLGYGLAGYAVGQLNRLRPGDQPDPRIQIGHNAVEFINNPGGGGSAITLGNASIYNRDPYDPNDTFWYPNGEDPKTVENGHSYPEHEQRHTDQGQLLGPLYLPSNVFGGLNGLMLDRRIDDKGRSRPDWHGPHNWNERGPQSNPPRPWASKVR